MGTTAQYGLRYPEPTELLGNAHAHIKNLAEDVAADLGTLATAIENETAAAYFTAHGGGGVNIAAAASSLIGFTPLGEVGGFVWSTDKVVYTGPSRLAMITATVRVAVQAAPADDYSTRAQILINGSFAAVESREYLLIQSVDAVLNAAATHSLSTLIVLNSGDSVQVSVANDSGFGESVNVDGLRYLNIAGLSVL